jgi:diacylglycerol kinase (ATP)
VIAWVSRTRARVGWSAEAIALSFRSEPSFRAWAVLLAGSLALCAALPLTAGERGLIVVTGLLVLAAELFNSGIETAIDDISEEIRPLAKRAKDAACAAVTLTALAAAAAWIAAAARLLA